MNCLHMNKYHQIEIIHSAVNYFRGHNHWHLSGHQHMGLQIGHRQQPSTVWLLFPTRGLITARRLRSVKSSWWALRTNCLKMTKFITIKTPVMILFSTWTLRTRTCRKWIIIPRIPARSLYFRVNFIFQRNKFCINSIKPLRMFW